MEQLLISQMICRVREGKYLALHPHIEPKTIQDLLSSQGLCTISLIPAAAVGASLMQHQISVCLKKMAFSLC